MQKQVTAFLFMQTSLVIYNFLHQAEKKYLLHKTKNLLLGMAAMLGKMVSIT